MHATPIIIMTLKNNFVSFERLGLCNDCYYFIYFIITVTSITLMYYLFNYSPFDLKIVYNI